MGDSGPHLWTLNDSYLSTLNSDGESRPPRNCQRKVLGGGWFSKQDGEAHLANGVAREGGIESGE